MSKNIIERDPNYFQMSKNFIERDPNYFQDSSFDVISIQGQKEEKKILRTEFSWKRFFGRFILRWVNVCHAPHTSYLSRTMSAEKNSVICENFRLDAKAVDLIVRFVIGICQM